MKILLSRAERKRYCGFDDRWLMFLGIPILSGVAFLLFMGSKRTLGGSAMIICYLVGLLHTLGYWIILRLMVIQCRAWLPRQEDTGKRIGIMMGVTVVIVFLLEIVSDKLIILLYPQILEYGWNNSSPVFSFVVALMLCVMVFAIYESIYFFVKYRQSLLEQERLAKANMQAQLSALKQQVNPHFLFNSLNTLVNIISEDSRKATLFTQRLAAVYRRILEYRHRELIDLEEEIAAVQDYIFLMQTRFEDKLRVNWRGIGAGSREEQHRRDPHLASRCIVPLSLQLLVENAIKHNVISENLPLTIDIYVGERELIVTNNLHRRQRSLDATGWGHQNIRQRYRLVTDREICITETEKHYEVRLPLINKSEDRREVPLNRPHRVSA